jgi:cytosine/uracil/thiamine/allantoin permease
MYTLQNLAGFLPCDEGVDNVKLLGSQLQVAAPIIITVLVVLALWWVSKRKYDRNTKARRILFIVVTGILLWIASVSAIHINFGGFTFCS